MNIVRTGDEDNKSTTIILTCGTSRKRKVGKETEYTLQKLLNKLKKVKIVDVTRKEYNELPKEEKAELKDAGWYQLGQQDPERRWPLNRWGITIDIDQAKPETKDKVFEVLGKYQFFMHHTLGSNPPEKPRYRVIIPLSFSIDLDVYKALATLLCYKIGTDYCDVKSSSSAKQLMYWPAECSDDNFELYVNDAYLFDPIVYLDAMWEHEFGGSYTDTSTWPQVKNSTGRTVRGNYTPSENGLQQSGSEKIGIVGFFCAAYDIEQAMEKFLSDVWFPVDNQEEFAEPRYTYHLATSTAGGVVYPDDRKDKGQDSSFFHSYHETDPYNGIQLNPFDLVRLHLFGQLDNDSKASITTRLPSYKEMVKLCSEDDGVQGRMVGSDETGFDSIDVSNIQQPEIRQETNVSDDGPPPTSDSSDGSGGGDGNSGKKGGLFGSLSVNDFADAGEIRVNPRTILVAIGDYVASGIVAFNELMQTTVWRGFSTNMQSSPATRNKPLEPEEVFNGRPFTDSDYTTWHVAVQDYPQYRSNNAAWQTGRAIPKNLVIDSLTKAAMENKFNPLKEYFESLPEWDGKTRGDEFIVDYIAGTEDNQWARDVARIWLIAAVARALRPGTPFHQVLVLYGQPGRGKSETFNLLCPDESLFTSSADIFSGAKELLETTSGKWIVEIAEVDQFSKRESGILKNVITTNADKARKAYARESSEVKRTWVPVATTNTDDFLTKEMTARRWLPIKVNETEPLSPKKQRKRIQKLQESRDQIWAHALHMYREADGKIPRLTPEQVKQQEIAVGGVTAEDARDAMESEMAGWIEKSVNDKNTITAREVAFRFHEGALDPTDIRKVTAFTKIAGRALKASGWSVGERISATDGDRYADIPVLNDVGGIERVKKDFRNQRRYTKDTF